MAFAKQYLKRNLKDLLKSMKCPTCSNGHLIIEKEAHKRNETSHSFNNLSTPGSGGMNEKYQSIFMDFFKCNNSNCNESCVLTGLINASPIYVYDDYYKTDVPSHIFKIDIKHIEPPIDLIEIPINLPENLKFELRKAFSLFWLDKDSAANKIRTILESLLTHLRIPKTEKTRKGTRKKMSLHSRIQKLDKYKQNLSESILAIKWIGNTGSHEANKLTEDDLVIAFEILEYTLKNIFDKHEDYLLKKIKTINKKKKV